MDTNPPASSEAGNEPERCRTNARRFRQNRKLVRDYETRPALRDLTGPVVVTTREPERNQHQPRRPRSTNRLLGWLGLGVTGALVLLGVGALIGIQLTRDDPQPDDLSTGVDVPSAPATNSSNEITSSATNADVPNQTTSSPTSGATTGAAEDLLGPAVAEIDLSTVDFEPGTTDLTPPGRAAVAELAQAFLIEPDRPVEVVVRTFSEASPGDNHGLSVAQAEVLLSELASHGVNPQRMTAVGLGSAGTERPDAAGAVRFRSDEPEVDARLTALGPAVVGPTQDNFDDTAVAQLTAVADLFTEFPNAQLELIGYAWSGADDDENHDQSHRILAMAAEALAQAGLAPSRMSEVGLGSTIIPIDQQLGVIEVETGTPAAISLALQDLAAENINFVRGTSTLTADDRALLGRIAEVLTLDPTTSIEVAAHAYTEPTSEANHDLSQQQGIAVFDFLVSAGIDADRLRLVWHGDPDHFASANAASVITFTVLR